MPPLRTGVLSLDDLKVNTNTTIQQFGIPRILEVVQAELAVHNGNMRDMLGGLCDFTTDAERVVGASAPGKFRKVDEFARVSTQKGRNVGVLGLPLYKGQYAVGWTADYEKRRTPADLAIELEQAQISHRLEVMADVKRSLFLATNYSFVDYMGKREVLGKSLAVKRLANADAFPIPVATTGVSFDATTHTHYQYLAATAPTDAFVRSLIANVVEHGHTAGLRINIAASNAGQWTNAALAGFQPLLMPGNQYPGPNQPNQTLDVSRVDNRQIGFYDGVPVWTRPWVPAISSTAGYIHVGDEGDGAQKPLAVRELDAGSLDLVMVAEIDLYPLRTQYLESYYGIGVQTRTNGAIGYFASGAGAYVAPTIVS